MAGDTADKQEYYNEHLEGDHSKTTNTEAEHHHVHVKDDNEDSHNQNNGDKSNDTTESANINNNSQTTRNNVSDKNASKDKLQDTKTSQYLENLKLSNSSAGLVLSEKDSNLLSDSTTVARFSPVWRQCLAASAAIMLTFAAGLTSGYSAILLPQLEQTDSPIQIDLNTKSWIAAIAALPMAPGCLIAGWLMEKFGRRTSLYIICVPFLLGWVLIAFANNLALMLLGRFATGLCVGLLGPLGPVYIGETTEPKYRGFFLAAISLAIAVGILVAHVIGTFMTWQWTAIICGIFPIVTIILLLLIPESPTWLISRGKEAEGIKAFHWLRGYGDEAKTELKSIIDSKKALSAMPVMTWREKLVSLKGPELLKPLFIMIMFFVTCQFSGVNAVAFYSIQMVESAVGKGLNHYVVMLIIDSVRVLMSVVACVVCKKYGRRPLCFISGIWTSISMVGLSMFLYFKPENMSWLPLTCLMMYICAVSIGFVPLPWIMCGEVFPTRVRGLGSGISSATTFVAFFIVVKTAPGMMTHMGEVLTFLFYGTVSLIGTGIMFFILPETKGKSLQEIEERFKIGKTSGPKV